jgi:bisphosphoglycerate-independent phosphoglycerate mutase (AlkP superfamily)
MTKYSSDFDHPVLFGPQIMKNGLAESISKHKLCQFHTAETEKYAHVSCFVNAVTSFPDTCGLTALLFLAVGSLVSCMC